MAWSQYFLEPCGAEGMSTLTECYRQEQSPLVGGTCDGEGSGLFSWGGSCIEDAWLGHKGEVYTTDFWT